jgi:hypothetical protein
MQHERVWGSNGVRCLQRVVSQQQRDGQQAANDVTHKCTFFEALTTATNEECVSCEDNPPEYTTFSHQKRSNSQQNVALRKRFRAGVETQRMQRKLKKAANTTCKHKLKHKHKHKKMQTQAHG